MKILILKDQFNLLFVLVNSSQTLHSVTMNQEKNERRLPFTGKSQLHLRVLFSTTPAELIKIIIIFTQTHKKLYNLNSLTIQPNESEETNVGKHSATK